MHSVPMHGHGFDLAEQCREGVNVLHYNVGIAHGRVQHTRVPARVDPHRVVFDRRRHVLARL